MKKLLFFIFFSTLSLSSFTYMQFSFGVGTADYDTTYLKGDSALFNATYSGYTDSNVMYSVSYALETTDLYIGNFVFDFDVDALTGSVGYAFGDLTEGSWTISGAISSLSYTADGYDVDSLFDTSGYYASAGYTRMAEEGTNWSVGLTIDLDDCDDSCEVLAGSVYFPIGDSNWNFGLGAAFGDGVTSLSIGPVVKF